MWFVKSRRAKNVDDFETWLQGGVVPTLNVFDNSGDTRATVLIFYGNRVGDIRMQGDVINTLQARMGTGGGNMPIVALQGNMIGRADTAGPQGKGFTDEGNPMFTLTKTDIHAVAYDEYNDRTGGQADAVDFYNASLSETSQTIRSHTATAVNIGGIMTNSTVRRLTPMECERLQGFPDGWTEGQADTHRYKQMGNAVAVPVVSWLVNRLMEVSNDSQ